MFIVLEGEKDQMIKVIKSSYNLEPYLFGFSG